MSNSRSVLCLWVVLAAAAPLVAAEFYVAPNGADTNVGTLSAPFATMQRAQLAVSPGDTVFLRSGTYRMSEAQIARKERIFAYVTLLDKSRQPGTQIHYRALLRIRQEEDTPW